MAKVREKTKREKVPPTYVEAHNKAVTRYRRYVTAFLFEGIFNIIGAVFFLIQVNIDAGDLTGEFLCNSIDIFIFVIPGVSKFLVGNLPWSTVIYLAIFLVTSILVCWWAVEARLGKRTYLFLSAGFYILDWIFMILIYALYNYFYVAEFISETSYYLMIVVHVFILVFMIMAFYQYYKVYQIEYARENPDKAIRKKVKKNKNKEVSVEDNSTESLNIEGESNDQS